MSLHPSLKIDRASAAARSVQTRIERIKELMKKGLWKEETCVIGLPKTKIIRIKAKKKVKAEEGVAAPAAAEGAAAGKPAEEEKAAKTAASASAQSRSALSGKGPSASGGKPAAGAKK